MDIPSKTNQLLGYPHWPPHSGRTFSLAQLWRGICQHAEEGQNQWVDGLNNNTSTSLSPHEVDDCWFCFMTRWFLWVFFSWGLPLNFLHYWNDVRSQSFFQWKYQMLISAQNHIISLVFHPISLIDVQFYPLAPPINLPKLQFLVLLH